jgi:hypothetical protein
MTERSAFCSSRGQQGVNLAAEHLRIKWLEERCHPLLTHTGQKVRKHEGGGTTKQRKRCQRGSALDWFLTRGSGSRQTKTNV